jgi:hypothetical protein
MTAIPPDYDSDPERRRSWEPGRETRDEVPAYCRHNFIPAERAGEVDLPL